MNANATKSKTVMVLGGTGFIGQNLGLDLVRDGHKVVLASRSPAKNWYKMAFPCKLVGYNENQEIFEGDLEGVDAIVNLVGESIAGKRWTQSQKEKIVSSRIRSCKGLANTLKRYQERFGKKIPVLVQASAIGYFGDRSRQELDESSEIGDGFLSATCLAWEQAAKECQDLVDRSCIYRIGLVLGHGGGVLEKLDQVYSRGMGAVLGDGKQGVSFIHMADLVSQMRILLTHDKATGVYCGTSEHPVSFEHFHTELAKSKQVKAPLKAPSLALRTILGQMADLVLQSQYIRPKRWAELNFSYQFPTIAEALSDLYKDLEKPGAERLFQMQWFPRPPDEIWRFFSDEKNLERITPDLLGFQVLGKDTPEIAKGTHIDYKLSLRGLPMRWRTLIETWNENQSFIDRQLKGPYKLWHHLHQFEELEGGTLMTDAVQYKLPAGLLGAATAGAFVRSDVEKIFAYRLERVPEILGLKSSNV